MIMRCAIAEEPFRSSAELGAQRLKYRHNAYRSRVSRPPDRKFLAPGEGYTLYLNSLDQYGRYPTFGTECPRLKPAIPRPWYRRFLSWCRAPSDFVTVAKAVSPSPDLPLSRSTPHLPCSFVSILSIASSASTR